jgi:hypothetical protein
MSAGDFFGDLGQRGINHAGIFGSAASILPTTLVEPIREADISESQSQNSRIENTHRPKQQQVLTSD